MQNPLINTLLNAVDRIRALAGLAIPMDCNGWRCYKILENTLFEIQKNLDFITEMANAIDKVEQINEQIAREIKQNHD